MLGDALGIVNIFAWDDSGLDLPEAVPPSDLRK